MSDDPVRGRTLRWSYVDGPVAGKTFEHTFAMDGTVTYRDVTAAHPGAAERPGEPAARYELARINDDIYAVSYLSKASGYALTTVIDTRSRTIVSFASNEKQLFIQHGRLGP